MRKLFSKVTRSGTPDKNRPREQQSTEQNKQGKKASNDDDNNTQEDSKGMTSEYGIVQVVNNMYINRRRLVNLLEERFPGRWSLKLKVGRWFIDLPEPLSPEDLKKCEDGSTSGSTG